MYRDVTFVLKMVVFTRYGDVEIISICGMKGSELVLFTEPPHLSPERAIASVYFYLYLSLKADSSKS